MHINDPAIGTDQNRHWNIAGTVCSVSLTKRVKEERKPIAVGSNKIQSVLDALITTVHKVQNEKVDLVPIVLMRRIKSRQLRPAGRAPCGKEIEDAGLSVKVGELIGVPVAVGIGKIGRPGIRALRRRRRRAYRLRCRRIGLGCVI